MLCVTRVAKKPGILEKLEFEKFRKKNYNFEK